MEGPSIIFVVGFFVGSSTNGFALIFLLKAKLASYLFGCTRLSNYSCSSLDLIWISSASYISFESLNDSAS